MKITQEKRYPKVLVLLLGALLVLPKVTTAIDEKFAYSFHKRLTPAGDYLSIVYGYCALQSGIVEKIVAFAPDNTAVAKLARTLFFIGDDGKLIATNSFLSVVPQITPDLWAAIVTILGSTKKNEIKIEEIGTLIRKTLKWGDQIVSGEKIKKAVLENDPLCKSITQKVEKIEQELATIDPKKDPTAYENKKNELKTTSGALKKAIDLLPESEKRTIKVATREEKSPEKIARILVDAIDECSTSKKLWPNNFGYIFISAFIVEKFTKQDIAQYLEQLPEKYKYLEKKDFRNDKTTESVLKFFKKVQKIDIVPHKASISINGHSFPNCAENTVLNAINHLAYDKENQKISLKKLAENSLIQIHPEVVEYYAKFSTPNLQRDIDAHTAWVALLSKKKDLEYLQENKYELSPNISSILKTIGHLIFYDPEKIASDSEVLEKIKKLHAITLEDKKSPNGTLTQKLTVDAPAPFMIISQLGIQAHSALLPQKISAHAKIFNTPPILENNNSLLLASVVPLLGKKVTEKLPSPSFDLLMAICQEISILPSIGLFWQTISLQNAGSILWRFTFKNPAMRDAAAFQNNFEEIFEFCRKVRPLAIFFEDNDKSLALVYTTDQKTGFNYNRVVDLLTNVVSNGLDKEADKKAGLQYVIGFIEKVSSPTQLFSGKQILTIREYVEKTGIPLASIEKPLFRLASRELANLLFSKGAKILDMLLIASGTSGKDEEKIAELIKRETAVSFNLRQDIQNVLKSSDSLPEKKTKLDALIKRAFDLAWAYTNSKAFTASLILASINTNHSEWLLKLPNGDLLKEKLAESTFKQAVSKGKAEKK